MSRIEARRHMQAPISLPRIALFTGGIDNHYASGLSQSLASLGLSVDVICNAEMDTEGMQTLPNLRFLMLYATSKSQNKIGKLMSFIRVYVRLIRYSATSTASVFHILWNYKFPLFDRTLLLIYYKLLGKRLAFTAHNVNAGLRDGSDTFLNRVTLRIQYQLVDHIFVHTEKMQDQLVKDFGVRKDRVCIIPFGTYDIIPDTELTSNEAKSRLGLRESDRAILFFGRITPYKGLDLLIDAVARIVPNNPNYRLIIAGEPMKEAAEQWQQVQKVIEQSHIREQVLQHIGFISNDEIEVYFKAADVLVLPYRQIFQSGVLFMSYSFGLPVIATDVGSFGSDIRAGITGYVCRSNDSEDLARAIEMYFSSELFRTLGEQRINIKESIRASHSWKIVAGKTGDAYRRISKRVPCAVQC